MPGLNTDIAPTGAARGGKATANARIAEEGASKAPFIQLTEAAPKTLSVTKVAKIVKTAPLKATISVAPIADHATWLGVTIKVNNKAAVTKLCMNKAEIIKFLSEVL